jgi:hypothetical protein
MPERPLNRVASIAQKTSRCAQKKHCGQIFYQETCDDNRDDDCRRRGSEGQQDRLGRRCHVPAQLIFVCTGPSYGLSATQQARSASCRTARRDLAEQRVDLFLGGGLLCCFGGLR